MQPIRSAFEQSTKWKPCGNMATDKLEVLKLLPDQKLKKKKREKEKEWR